MSPRNSEKTRHRWEGSIGDAIEYHWDGPVAVGGVRLVLDSNLNNDKPIAGHTA